MLLAKMSLKRALGRVKLAEGAQRTAPVAPAPMLPDLVPQPIVLPREPLGAPGDSADERLGVVRPAVREHVDVARVAAREPAPALGEEAGVRAEGVAFGRGSGGGSGGRAAERRRELGLFFGGGKRGGRGGDGW